MDKCGLRAAGAHRALVIDSAVHRRQRGWPQGLLPREAGGPGDGGVFWVGAGPSAGTQETGWEVAGVWPSGRRGGRTCAGIQGKRAPGREQGLAKALGQVEQRKTGSSQGTGL